MPIVDQMVPSFVRHDAISNHVVQVQRALRAAGYRSEIYWEHLDPRLEGSGRPFRERPPGGAVLYHASTSSAMGPWLVDAAAGGQTVLLDYHNITPPSFFARWEPVAARSMVSARRELAEVVPCASGALADSAYNEAELRRLGMTRTAVGPLLVDFSEYHREPDPATLQRLRAAGGPVWLFVGRLAPNKCQHDVIAAFAVHCRLNGPGGRLILVGGATSGRYQRRLEAQVSELGLDGRVEFAGSAPFPELLAYFAAADVFVCLSEHEGFCVPVIEAMELGVPVVSARAAALEETVAGAGVLVDDKDPLTVALAVGTLLGDPERRQHAVEAGRARAAEFHLDVTAPLFVSRLQTLLESGGVPAPVA